MKSGGLVAADGYRVAFRPRRPFISRSFTLAIFVPLVFLFSDKIPSFSVFIDQGLGFALELAERRAF